MLKLVIEIWLVKYFGIWKIDVYIFWKKIIRNFFRKKKKKIFILVILFWLVGFIIRLIDWEFFMFFL